MHYLNEKTPVARRVEYTFQAVGRFYTAGLLRTPAETLCEHAEIVEALAAHDIRGATEATRAHTARTRIMLEETVKNMRKLGMDPLKVPLDQFGKAR